MSRYISLNNGYFIPTLGLSTFSNHPACKVGWAVRDAIDVGYTYIDCAWVNKNEGEIGASIQAKIEEGVVKRQDLFISSKLWNNYHSRESVVPMLRKSLQALQLDYLDLFLIHWPVGFKETRTLFPLGDPSAYSDVDYLETWKGMEDCVQLGLARSIGLANFNSEQIDRILRHSCIKPAVNQIEVHLELSQERLIRFCHDREITVVAYSPLGSAQLGGVPNFPEPTITDPKVEEIADKHSKTPAQVVLNYLINNLGVVAIPGSVNKIRIVEHLDVYDFQLDSKDIEYLKSCNENKRIFVFEGFYDHQYYPFSIEF